MTAKHSKALGTLCPKCVCSMGSRDRNSQLGIWHSSSKIYVFSVWMHHHSCLEPSCSWVLHIFLLFPPYILPHGIFSNPIRHSFHSQFFASFRRQSLTNSLVVHWIIMEDVIFYCKFLMKWIKAKETKIMYLTLSSTSQRNARLKFLTESYLTTGFYRVDPFISTQLIEGILH